ncbi:hypothetical protein P968_02809 [Mycobacterium tuberculosis KT-0085]|nr:hypothetical protein P968_02809 [Mycobacterium tuberculosis KT-0085]
MSARLERDLLAAGQQVVRVPTTSAGEPCRPIAHQTQKLSTRRAKRDLYVSVSVLCVPRGGCVGVTDAVSRWFVPDHLVSGSLCVCRPLGVGVEQYCRH